MSEKVKITVVMHDEKLNGKFEGQSKDSVIVTHDTSMTLMSTLLKNNLISGSFCGGRGDCGRCRIQFLKGVTIPTALERSVLEPEELRQGYRLACLTKPKDDCVIRLALVNASEIAIVSEMIDVTENIDYNSQRNFRTQNHKSDVMESEQDALIAVDLGTTTIAMQLMDIDTGRVIDTYCEMNPQRRYGSDVLSRIQASCEGSRDALQRLAVEVLERGVARFRHRAVTVKCMCIAGNTTMEHLLMGYDVSSLGRSPFTPVEIGLQEYKHPDWDFTVWLVPGISAFVGGDIVAGLYSCGMLVVNANVDGPEITLFIDLGTNGEMAISDGTRMIVTATAAGPAFEGGAGACIVGSDMVACTAELLKQGVLDETGLLAEPFFTEGVSIQSANEAGYTHNSVQGELYRDNKNIYKNIYRKEYRITSGKNEQSLYMTKEDVRSLQMAKAAVRAGVEILLNRLSGQATERQQDGSSQADESHPSEHQGVRVYLAGGFGYYLDAEAAFLIGLLPEHLRGHVQAVGNTSLAGAYRIGRDLWQHRIDKQMLEQSLSSIESINLAKQEEFERLYIQYLNFIPSQMV